MNGLLYVIAASNTHLLHPRDSVEITQG